MKNIFELDHREIWQVLPWHLNGSLQGSEKIKVHNHVAACLVCRRELHRLSLIADYARADLQEQHLDEAFDKLLQRIDGKGPNPVRFSPLQVLHTHAMQLWRILYQKPLLFGGLFAVQSVLLILVTGFWFWQNSIEQQPRYHTLSAPQTRMDDALQFRLVFAEGAGESDIAAVLQSVNANLVAGPSTNGVYTIAVAEHEKDPEHILTVLRNNPKIRFAASGNVK
jgi:hypothetical protein